MSEFPITAGPLQIARSASTPPYLTPNNGILLDGLTLSYEGEQVDSYERFLLTFGTGRAPSAAEIDAIYRSWLVVVRDTVDKLAPVWRRALRLGDLHLRHITAQSAKREGLEAAIAEELRAWRVPHDTQDEVRAEAADRLLGEIAAELGSPEQRVSHVRVVPPNARYMLRVSLQLGWYQWNDFYEREELRELKTQDVPMMARCGVDDQLREEAYLRAWAGCVDEVLRHPAFDIESALPEDLCFAEVYAQQRAQSREDFERALRRASRLGQWLNEP